MGVDFGKREDVAVANDGYDAPARLTAGLLVRVRAHAHAHGSGRRRNPLDTLMKSPQLN